MAASSSKLKLHQGPVDMWSIREKLALACSVMKSGDQNWVSVSRAIKPYVEASRPANWFSQKNCALQYSDLLEKVETPKRKRGDGGEIDTPADQIFRKLMTERIEELRKIALDEQQRYKKLKREVECIKSGQYDDRLSEVWEQMQAEKAEEEAAKEAEKKAIEDARAQAQVRGFGNKRQSVTSQSSLSEQDDTQDSYPEFPLLEIPKLDEDETPSLSLTPETLGVTTQQSEQRTKAHPPTSPLLSSLLQSKLKSANSLQQLKNLQEAEQAEALTQQHKADALTQQHKADALTQQHKVQQIALHLKQSAESAVSQLQQSAESSARESSQAGAQVKEIAHTDEATAGQMTAPLSQVRDLITPQLQQVKLATSAASCIGQTESLPTSPSCAAPTLSKLLFTPAQPKPLSDASLLSSVTPTPIITVTKAASSLEVVETPEPRTEPVEQDSADESATVDVTAVDFSSTEGDVPEGSCDQSCDNSGGKEQAADDDGTTDDMTTCDFTSQSRGRTTACQDDEDSSEVAGCSSFLSVDEEVSIKGDPPSPASSVSSKVSETGAKIFKRNRRGRGRGRRGRSSRRSVQDDDKKDDASSKHSDADLSDDERESDDPMPASLFSESIPNSPASLSMCSDTEDEKAFKTWKKSIMLVWRSAANHKYANVFLHPVTNEIAPGYKGIVHRPMDLGTIKKNIENGGLRTTSEFQRDMMLMFTNAIMYNNTDQPVFKMATEMYNDVMQHIEQYVSTQLMVQSSETKVLRQSRRGELQEKEEEGKKRRTSSEQPPEGGKTKKRKTRADDT